MSKPEEMREHRDGMDFGKAGEAQEFRVGEDFGKAGEASKHRDGESFGDVEEMPEHRVAAAQSSAGAVCPGAGSFDACRADRSFGESTEAKEHRSPALPELLCPAGSAETMPAAAQSGAGAVCPGAGSFNACRADRSLGEPAEARKHIFPELLCPAGSAEAMVAAVQNDADAVYLGAGDFNARRTADNFEGALDDAVRYCQARGVKVYVTLNTMVRQDELARLEATIEQVCAAGADGVIVSDAGTARAIRRMAPTLPLHASTQMAAHNPQAVEFLARQGFRRVVLAREMSFEEIARCADLGAELEVFVHGALCVSCSGQCLMSSMIGGRSGNRGLCAQPCRQRYALDGREGYLLSTRDLCGLANLRALTEAGVASLKVEGRLKRPEYVAQTAAIYRAALDALGRGGDFDAENARRELAQLFNRGGFTRGYGPGPAEPELMYRARPNHLGVEIGRCRRDGEIELAVPVDERDALVLRRVKGTVSGSRGGRDGAARAGHVNRDGVRSENPALSNAKPHIGNASRAETMSRAEIEFPQAAPHGNGAEVWNGSHAEKTARTNSASQAGDASMAGAGSRAEVKFQQATLHGSAAEGRTDSSPEDAVQTAPFEDIPVRMLSSPSGSASLPAAKRGDRLVRLTSEVQMRALRASYAGEIKKFLVDAKLTLRVGEAARLTLGDGARKVAVEGEIVQAARTRPADPERIRAQIAKLGDTPFELRGWSAEIDEDAYLPVSALNELRRRAADALLEARRDPPHRCGKLTLPELPRQPRVRPELIAQSGDPDILRRAIDAGADFACFAPEDLRAEALDAALSRLPERFDLALPPVMGEATLNALHDWAKANAGRIRRTLLTNIGQFGLTWPGEAVENAEHIHRTQQANIGQCGHPRPGEADASRIRQSRPMSVGQLGLDWPGERVGDYMLNIANELSVAQLADWGVHRYTPSIELNRAQIEALGGERELVVYGRIPLMQLRHCPLRAAADMKGLHRDCRRCDACPPEERVGAKALTDRLGARFPLRRIASDEGCVVQLLNSATLMLLRRRGSLPASAAWRLLLGPDDPVETVVRLHRLALDGGDPRSDAGWPELDAMNATTGHYFRGVE